MKKFDKYGNEIDVTDTENFGRYFDTEVKAVPAQQMQRKAFVPGAVRVIKTGE